MLKGALRTNFLSVTDQALARTLSEIFGSDDDPMDALERRAHVLLPDQRVILWQGDPQTFEFNYVSPCASEILGYPCERWTTEPTFWADTVVHDEDRENAISFCALATGRKQDHDFEYRAIAADGRIVYLHDVVRVIVGDKGVPVVLRGIMIDVTQDRNRET
jgi:PAS domain S-box-containing protein